MTTNRYSAKVLFYDRHHKGSVIKVPRVAPPRHKVEPVMKKIYDALGIDVAEDGRIAFTSLTVVVQEMLAQDVGLHGMPQLPDFLAGLKLPIFIHWDATGFGRNQFNTIAIRNPYHPKSAEAEKRDK